MSCGGGTCATLTPARGPASAPLVTPPGRNRHDKRNSKKHRSIHDDNGTHPNLDSDANDNVDCFDDDDDDDVDADVRRFLAPPSEPVPPAVASVLTQALRRICAFDTADDSRQQEEGISPNADTNSIRHKNGVLPEDNDEEQNSSSGTVADPHNPTATMIIDTTSTNQVNNTRTHHDEKNDVEDESLSLLSQSSLNPRDYQIHLLALAQQQNCIVHLGTGMGKTLIAIRLLQQTHVQKAVLLVPSVALAVQHTDTIATHCAPMTADTATLVATATQWTVATDASRQRLANARVIVATHGAYLELLGHYGDLFAIAHLDLLVVDECHHAVGQSLYVRIFREFYHCTPVEQRPRVLGLTASPLINIKPHKVASASLLEEMVVQLETTLDARIVSLPRSNGRSTGDGATPAGELPNQTIRESTVHFAASTVPLAPASSTHATPPSTTARGNSTAQAFPNFPSFDARAIHVRRRRLLNQWPQLWHDTGAAVVHAYVPVAIRAWTRHPDESLAQFHALNDYAKAVVEWAATVPSDYQTTDKLQKLQNLLQEQYATEPAAVGLLFCQRRLTAAALHVYLSSASSRLPPASSSVASSSSACG